MSDFDFDTAPERRGTASYKWDTPSDPDVIPMWVADMDFRTAPAIIGALRERVDHGVFGYTKVSEAYYRACTDWFARRHGWTFDAGSVVYTSGVVPAVSAIIKAMTRSGDKVILQTPAYNCFYSSIRNNGCVLSPNMLLRDTDGRYSIDFDDLEQRAADPEARLLILCNPHNPSGRVWTRAELERVADICLRHDVFVIADEIHCELTYGDIRYTPYGILGERCRRRAAICVSPSKAFNIAGLQIANIVAEDDDVRRRIDRAINDNEVCDVNPFGVVATIAAYERGGEWLDALRAYLWDNYCFAREYIAANMPLCKVTPAEGTYLLWVDVSAYGIPSETLCDRLEAEARVKLSPGPDYGPGGEGFVRINLACPRSRLAEGLRRIAAWLAAL